MFDQIMYEDIPEAIINNGFTAPSGYYFVGWNTAQDGSGTFYSDGQIVTNLTGAGDAITLYAIWDNCPGGNICYIANGTNIVGSMGKQTISNTDTEATLYAPNYKRDGYGFVSWNTSPDGLGTNYGPNQTIEFTAGQYSTSGLKLYAKWVASTGNIQNWSGCSGMGVGDVTALKDIRDNNVYAVAKLADGKCWMIENLRLADKDSSNNDINLSSTNTHNPSLPLTNRYYSTTSNHLSPPVDPTQTSWCTDETPPCINHSRLATNNTTLFINNTASNYDISSDVYSYGNYYNWYSATAGHGKIGKGYTYDYHAPGDICPTGWHLPKGSYKIGEVNNEYWSLIVTGLNNGVKPANYDDTANPYYVGNEAKLVSNILRSYPNNFVKSGMVYRNFWTHRRGYNGRYWSASAFVSGTAFTMHFYDSESSSSDEVNPGTRDEWEFYGMTVRCIAGT
jgi:uncharacterized protein (TIGR02145 family)